MHPTCRDDGQTIGMYLIIEHVQPSDNGQYVCSVSNTDDQIIEMQSEIVIIGELYQRIINKCGFQIANVDLVLVMTHCGNAELR